MLLVLSEETRISEVKIKLDISLGWNVLSE